VRTLSYAAVASLVIYASPTGLVIIQPCSVSSSDPRSKGAFPPYTGSINPCPVRSAGPSSDSVVPPPAPLAASSASTSTSAAAAARLAFARFVHGQSAAVKRRPVERADGRLRVGLAREVDECEPARLTGVTVGDKAHL
jgi:hypothetical protein